MNGPIDYDDESDLDDQRLALADRLDREKVGIYSEADIERMEREGLE